MKLRNSFISLKNLSAELNIPITSYIFENKKSITDIKSSSTTHQTNTMSSSSSSSMSSSFSNPIVKTSKNILASTSVPSAIAAAAAASITTTTKPPKTMTTMTKINDENTNFEHEIQSHQGVSLPENTKKIDKQLKASGLRVRNLKKSMLNDNRLIKLKDRLLKRSKSTAGTIIEKVATTITQNRNTKDGKHLSKKEQQHQQQKQEQQYRIKDEIRNDNHIHYDKIENYCDDDGSKEANQNKENECPMKVINDGKESPKMVYSPNRNRVKMGTRVFSSQFLNKSFDNIYEQAVLNICQFESVNSIDKESTIDDDDDENSNSNGKRIKGNGSKKRCDDDDDDKTKSNVDNQSLNTSHNSSHLNEKVSNNNKFNNSISPSTEAFVIRKYT